MSNPRVVPAQQQTGMPPILFRFGAAMAASALLSLACTLLMTRLLHPAHPYGTTLFWDGFIGSDFKVFAERSHLFRTPGYWAELNYPFTYPAPLAVTFALLYKLPHPLVCYQALCIAGLALWCCWLAHALIARGVRTLHALVFALLILVAAWPVTCLLNTGNIEGLLAIVLAAGVWAVLRERWWLGATLIGMAASMKWFPFILLALLVSRRRYREFAWGLAVAAFATLASLALLGPGILTAQHQIAAGMRFIKVAFLFSTQPDALNYSHSLFSLLKFAVVWLAGLGLGDATPSHQQIALLDTTLRVYMAVAAIAGVAVYLLRIRRMPMLNQVLALTVYAVLVPPLSADYTLLELLLPFALLCLYAVDAWRSGEQARGLSACFACFAAIFGWETFLTLRYSFDRPMRTLALCALLVIVLRSPFPWPLLDRGAA
jgi:hypothetical protein